jgi:hypothetical protein
MEIGLLIHLSRRAAYIRLWPTAGKGKRLFIIIYNFKNERD